MYLFGDGVDGYVFQQGVAFDGSENIGLSLPVAKSTKGIERGC